MRARWRSIYTKHHQAYINNANKLLKDHPALAALDVERAHRRPRQGARGDPHRCAKQRAAATATTRSSGPSSARARAARRRATLAAAINSTFGSFDKFKEEFGKAAGGRFGSGWAWLYVTADKKLAIGSTANQDSPLMGKAVAGIEGKPVIGLDVWEHAYYLNYQNRRPDYVSAWWNVVNWDAAEANFAAAT